MPTKKNIVLLGRQDRPTAILYNSLRAADLTPAGVIVEGSEAKLKFLKRRIKRFGPFKVIGQIAFRVIAVPMLKITSRRRIREIYHQFALDSSPILPTSLTKIKSVNSEECVAALR